MPVVFVSTASRTGIFQNEMSFRPTSGTPVSTAFCGNCASADKGKVECECSHVKARCPGASLHLEQSGPLSEPHRRPESYFKSSTERGQRKMRGFLGNSSLPSSSPPHLQPPFHFGCLLGSCTELLTGVPPSLLSGLTPESDHWDPHG